ncbi:scavenger receptor cysteine-rich type 1 protein M130-like [Thunnus thynnus]|uniref:scavenger receptor cysteine-rich type 1 protein M130-like n=1 Tax=Thunnus thynnus TaxID=8237 RepID=UPI0035296000
MAKLQQPKGGTNTGKALYHILHNNFKPNVGMRADSHKVAILITDGESSDNVSLASQHLKDTGIEVYAIGVGNAKEAQLRVIASDPIKNHVYMLSHFSSLLNIINNLTINLCNSTNSSLDSVRLVNGTTMCSGRLEVKFNQFNQSWSSVCEADFDQQDAEVVCSELSCGAPSVLQGALYGEVEAPIWTKEFQCGGHESALLDCGRSDSNRSTCSPGKAVGLTCSEPVRLVGGASRCAGTLEVKRTKWRPVQDSDWTLKEAAAACGDLDCGSAVSIGRRNNSLEESVWWIRSDCVQSGYALRECASSSSSSSIVELLCSGKSVSDIIYDSNIFLPLAQ